MGEMYQFQELKMGNIKVQSKELRRKSLEELFEMRKKMEYHLIEAVSPKNLGNKHFNIKEERKNIARVNTIIKEKER
jgi:ribosomal protein L29